MIERNAWVLPAPDSPTTPTLSPSSMAKLRSLTAATSPSGVANRTERPSTSRTAGMRFRLVSRRGCGRAWCRSGERREQLL